MLLDTSSWPSTCPLSPLFSTSGFKVFFCQHFIFSTHCEGVWCWNSSLSGSFQNRCAGCCQKERWSMGAPQFLQIHQKFKYCKGSWTSWKKEARIGGNLKKSWRWRCARRWDARKPWSHPTFATTPLNWTLQASGVLWALEVQKPGQQGSIATQKVFACPGSYCMQKVGVSGIRIREVFK